MFARTRTGLKVMTTLAATMTAGLLLGGCSKAVESSDVEKQVNQQLSAKVGQQLDDVSCPKDLDAKVGSKERCTIKADGQRYGTTVKVTDVQGSKVKFNIQVDQKPKH